ncbi:unnamed protein product, partial [Owenia fusiformis]
LFLTTRFTFVLSNSLCKFNVSSLQIEENSPKETMIASASCTDEVVIANISVPFKLRKSAGIQSGANLFYDLVVKDDVDYEQIEVYENIKITKAPDDDTHQYATVTVLPVNEYAPSFDNATNSQHFIQEDVSAGTIITTFTASDEDKGVDGDIEFSISGKDESAFRIGLTTGVLYLERSTKLSESPYTIIIIASDNGTEVRKKVTHEFVVEVDAAPTTNVTSTVGTDTQTDHGKSLQSTITTVAQENETTTAQDKINTTKKVTDNLEETTEMVTTERTFSDALLNIHMLAQRTGMDNTVNKDEMNKIMGQMFALSNHSILNDAALYEKTDIKRFKQLFIQTASNLLEERNSKYLNSSIELIKILDIFSEAMLHSDAAEDITATNIKIEKLSLDYTTNWQHVIEKQGVGFDGNKIFIPNNVSTDIPERVIYGVYKGGKFPKFKLKNDSSSETYEVISDLLTSIKISSISSQLFSQPVQIVMKIAETNFSSRYPVCGFIDFSSESFPWKTDGCSVHAANRSHVTCYCNHLTNFAVLMQVQSLKMSPVVSATLEIITRIGCGISISTLVVSLLILFRYGLKSERMILLINLMLALLIALIVLVAGLGAIHDKLICQIVAMSLHYFFLVVFTMMLIEGVILLCKLYKPLQRRPKLGIALVLGWVTPLAVVVATAASPLGKGYGTKRHCWLSIEIGTIWTFVGPAVFVIMLNLIVLAAVLRVFLSVRVNARKSEVEKIRSSVRAAVTLLPLLGVTWLFGILAIDGAAIVFQYIFAVLNSLQGFFMFIFHVLLNEEVRLAWQRKRYVTSRGPEAISSLSDLHNKMKLNQISPTLPAKMTRFTCTTNHV